MTTHEANDIIARYMGYYIDGSVIGGYGKKNLEGIITHSASYIPRYDHSLDSLIPVWERLDILPEFFSNGLNHYEVCVDTGQYIGVEHDMHYGDATTLQQAACIATAKAIGELNDTK